MQWYFQLHPVLQAFLASLLMYAMTALGALCVFFSGKIGRRRLTFLTAAAAGIMIAASFFSLLLPALEYEGALPACYKATIGFCLGGALTVGADVLFAGRGGRGEGSNRHSLLYFSVTLHNVPEGLAVGVAFAQCAGGGAVSALLLALGVAAQNFPEGLCVALPLRAGGMSARRSFVFAQGSGAVEIPACVLGAFAAIAVTGLLPWALSFSAGAMIAVVCGELIPECFSKNKTLSGAGILFGFCLMMLLDTALG